MRQRVLLAASMAVLTVAAPSIARPHAALAESRTGPEATAHATAEIANCRMNPRSYPAGFCPSPTASPTSVQAPAVSIVVVTATPTDTPAPTPTPDQWCHDTNTGAVTYADDGTPLVCDAAIDAAPAEEHADPPATGPPAPDPPTPTNEPAPPAIQYVPQYVPQVQYIYVYPTPVSTAPPTATSTPSPTPTATFTSTSTATRTPTSTATATATATASSTPSTVATATTASTPPAENLPTDEPTTPRVTVLQVWLGWLASTQPGLLVTSSVTGAEHGILDAAYSWATMPRPRDFGMPPAWLVSYATLAWVGHDKLIAGSVERWSAAPNATIPDGGPSSSEIAYYESIAADAGRAARGRTR